MDFDVKSPFFLCSTRVRQSRRWCAQRLSYSVRVQRHHSIYLHLIRSFTSFLVDHRAKNNRTWCALPKEKQPSTRARASSFIQRFLKAFARRDVCFQLKTMIWKKNVQVKPILATSTSWKYIKRRERFRPTNPRSNYFILGYARMLFILSYRTKTLCDSFGFYFVIVLLRFKREFKFQLKLCQWIMKVNK